MRRIDLEGLFDIESQHGTELFGMDFANLMQNKLVKFGRAPAHGLGSFRKVFSCELKSMNKELSSVFMLSSVPRQSCECSVAVRVTPPR